MLKPSILHTTTTRAVLMKNSQKCSNVDVVFPTCHNSSGSSTCLVCMSLLWEDMTNKIVYVVNYWYHYTMNWSIERPLSSKVNTPCIFAHRVYIPLALIDLAQSNNSDSNQTASDFRSQYCGVWLLSDSKRTQNGAREISLALPFSPFNTLLADAEKSNPVVATP